MLEENLGGVFLPLGTANVHAVELEGRGLFDHDLVLLVHAQVLAGHRVFELLFVEHAQDFRHHGSELVGDQLVVTVLGLALLLIESFSFLVGHAGAAAEALRVNDDSLDAAGHVEAVVLDILAGAAENGVQQLLFRRQLAFRFRRHFAD